MPLSFGPRTVSFLEKPSYQCNAAIHLNNLNSLLNSVVEINIFRINFKVMLEKV